MPFKSVDELVDMVEKDPKMARMYVSRAKRVGKPVVSRNNPGYGGGDKDSDHRKKAIKDRLARMVQEKKQQSNKRLNDEVRKQLRDKGY